MSRSENLTERLLVLEAKTLSKTLTKVETKRLVAKVDDRL